MTSPPRPTSLPTFPALSSPGRQGRKIVERDASLSGFANTLSAIFDAPPSQARGLRVLEADWFQTPLGEMIAITCDDRLCLVEFHDRRALELDIALLRKRLNAPVVPAQNAVLAEAARQFLAYFQGTRTAFTLPLHIEGSPFQTSVWDELLRIPLGETRSYADLAIALQKPGGQRAIGQANGMNRLCIVIPCHRVIRAGGDPAGYGGGAWRKQWLLDHEARLANKPTQRSLLPLT